MILETRNGQWHEVADSLARRWIMCDKAEYTYKAGGMQYIDLLPGFTWAMALGEIDEYRFQLKRLAGLR